MRVNEPITQREFQLSDKATLMSTTDARGNITYANDTFIEVSGFSRQEIEGQPHNLVRHPDMPREAFADMWTTLKAGEPWSALVKNRRKNGDHYWVHANAVPVVRNGQPVGYMSVRTKPTREEVAAAEQLYRDMREGKAGNRRLHKGVLLRSGLLGWTSRRQTISVRWRIRSVFLALLPLFMCAGTALDGEASTVAGLGGVAAAVLLVGCLALESQIARPLEQLRREAIRVATGESQMAPKLDRVDEIGMTMRAVGQLGLMFRWLADDVSQQVVAVQHAADEIAQGNADLSSRTEQSATSVEETASAMEQMTATVKTNADTAAQANTLSCAARDAAAQGGQTVSEVVTTMSTISTSSSQIADIIGLIDSIAFQTNVLALNAAVEAARAGDAGRGFAVVAGEVRALAQRSAQAAKEIKTLIADSADKVETGAKLVDEAGRMMGSIVSQVRRVSDLISEISVATQEQSNGIVQVSQAVAHMDHVTQQNAALVEQSAMASGCLRQQTARLTQAVAAFNANNQTETAYSQAG